MMSAALPLSGSAPRIGTLSKVWLGAGSNGIVAG